MGEIPVAENLQKSKAELREAKIDADMRVEDAADRGVGENAKEELQIKTTEKRQEFLTAVGELEAARKNIELAEKGSQGPLAEKFQKLFVDSSAKIKELEERVPKLQTEYETLQDELFKDANKGSADRLN